MKYQITLEPQALRDIKYFNKCDKEIVKKIQNLLGDLIGDPFVGIGKPEPLKFDLQGCWSRRITREHRLVYRVSGIKVTVLSCRYHY